MLKKFIAIFFFLFIWIYLILRAYYVPIVHDEAATFFHYVHAGKFIPPNAHWDANNHILNSALTYVSYLIFGSSELALRLSNLIFFPLFIFFCYKISQELSNKLLTWAFVIILCCAHALIEFFAYSRGYAMSMALLLGSIWFLIKVFKENTLRYYLFCLLFLVLFMIANLTLLNSALIIIGLLCINIALNFKLENIRLSLKAFALIIFIGCLPILLFIKLLLEMKKRGLLYYGNLDGFWNQTVKTLMKLFFQSENPIIGIFIIIFFIIILGLFAYHIIKHKSFKNVLNSKMLFFYLFIGNLTAVMLLAKLFRVNYPEDRTALYFFIFFIGSFIFLLDQVKISLNPRIQFIFVLPFLIFPVNFIYSMNLSYTTFWKTERIPGRFCDKIIEFSKKENNNFTIGGYQIRRLCWAYQNFRKGGSLNQLQCDGYPELNSDFQIVKICENPKWLTYYDPIDYDPYSELSLLKRKHFLKKNPISTIPVLKTTIEKDMEFYGIYSNSIADTFINKSLCIDFNFSILAKQKPFKACFVVNVTDEKNQNLVYEFIELDWKKTEWNGEKGNFTGNILINKLPKDTHNLIIYIWNMHKVSYSIGESYCQINELNTDY